MQSRKKLKKPLDSRTASQRGFTLIETLIVVAISAMLSAIAIGYSSVGRSQVALSVEASKISELVLQAESLSIATYGNAANGYYVAAYDYNDDGVLNNDDYLELLRVVTGVQACPHGKTCDINGDGGDSNNSDLSAFQQLLGSFSCGYGVFFDMNAQVYSLFSYHPQGAMACPDTKTITHIQSADMQIYTQGTWNIHVANNVMISAGANNDGIAAVLFYPPQPTTFISQEKDSGFFTNKNSNIYLKTTDGASAKTIMISSGGQVNL